MPDRPHILLLAYYFPPYESAGYSIRTVKFLKFLARQRFRVTVLCADPTRPIQPPQADSSRYLLEEIPAPVKVIRTPAPVRPPAWQFTGTAGDRWHDLVLAATESLWARRVYRRALRIARSGPVDVLYVTAPQYSLLPVARSLRRQLELPLVVDLRDDWVDGPPYLRKPRWLRAIHRALERQVVDSANRVVVVTPESLTSYQSRYPQQAGKFRYISNGFDGDEFSSGSDVPYAAASDRFTIMTAGGYSRAKRSPEHLLRAIGRLAGRRADVRERLRICFVGEWIERDFRPHELDKFGVYGMIEEVPPRPKPELVKDLRAANLLLCINSTLDSRAVPGKLYEYWAAGGPPVLLLDDGASAARSLVERHELGAAVSRDDMRTIEQQIETYFDAWLAGNPAEISRNGLARFDRRHLAAEMGNLIDELLPSRSIE